MAALYRLVRAAFPLLSTRRAWFDFRGKRDGYADYFKKVRDSAPEVLAASAWRWPTAPPFPDYSGDPGHHSIANPVKDVRDMGWDRHRWARSTERLPERGGGSLRFLPQSHAAGSEKSDAIAYGAIVEPLWFCL